MNLDQNAAAIVQKWYDALPFDRAYDAEFAALLAAHPNLPQTTIEQYEFDESPAKAGFNLLLCLYFCEALEQRYRACGIPREVLLETLSDLVIWTDTHRALTGTLGITELNWIRYTLDFRLFRLGRLQFMLRPCPADIPALGVTAGDPVLTVHIPRGGPLDRDECLASFERAKAFYATHFPTQKYACFTCFSWLLDDTLARFTSEQSNIRRFARLFTPVMKKECYDVLRFTVSWSFQKENLADFTPTTPFTARVMEAVQAGEQFYIVFGYLPK